MSQTLEALNGASMDEVMICVRMRAYALLRFLVCMRIHAQTSDIQPCQHPCSNHCHSYMHFSGAHTQILVHARTRAHIQT